jgi:hypothetical protein
MNGLGCLLGGEVVSDRLDQFGHSAEDTPPQALVGAIAQEALDHGGPRCTSRREGHGEAGVLLPPRLHVGVLGGGVVIRDQVQFLAGGRRIVNQPQELQPFFMGVLLHPVAADRAMEGVQSSQPGGGAGAPVIVGQRRAATLLPGQAGRGAVQRLNRAPVVEASDQGVLGRVELPAEEVVPRRRKGRSIAELEAFAALRLHAVLAPDAANAGLTDARRLSHGSRAPLGGVRRGVRGRLADDFEDRLGRDGGLAAGPRGIFRDARDALGQESRTPTGHRRGRRPKLPGNRFILLALGGQQQHLGSLRHPPRHTAPPGVAFQLESLVFGWHDGWSDAHVHLANTGCLLERLTQPICGALHEDRILWKMVRK